MQLRYFLCYDSKYIDNGPQTVLVLFHNIKKPLLFALFLLTDTYIRCFIGEHVKPEGWSNWNNTDNYKTTRYSEYKNYGPSADSSKKELPGQNN